MNRAETLRVLTLLAQLTGPAPEGDAWDLTANAWAAVLADVPEADMLRAVKLYVTGGPGRAPGSWWPKPGELLALIRTDASDPDEAEWQEIINALRRGAYSPGGGGYKPEDPIHARAFSRACDVWKLRQAEAIEIATMRKAFLAACREIRANPPKPATVTAFPRPVGVPQLAADEWSAFNRHAFASVPRAKVAKPEPILRAPVDEEELRRTAREQVERIRARVGGR